MCASLKLHRRLLADSQSSKFGPLVFLTLCLWHASRQNPSFRALRAADLQQQASSQCGVNSCTFQFDRPLCFLFPCLPVPFPSGVLPSFPALAPPGVAFHDSVAKVFAVSCPAAPAARADVDLPWCAVVWSSQTLQSQLLHKFVTQDYLQTPDDPAASHDKSSRGLPASKSESNL